MSGVCKNLGVSTEQVLCMILTPGKSACLACFTKTGFAHILNSEWNSGITEISVSFTIVFPETDTFQENI